MGKLAQQLIQLDRGTLIQDLTQAYADEWFAHYNYFFASNIVGGPDSPAVIKLLRYKAGRALVHANRLATRISQLGGKIIPKLDDLSQHATDKPFKLPENVRDLDGVLKAVLDAERTSIRTYRRLYEKTAEKDAVTQLLAIELLAKAVEGEEQIEKLLGEPAPEMDGR
jgi:bacterioferritin